MEETQPSRRAFLAGAAAVAAVGFGPEAEARTSKPQKKAESPKVPLSPEIFKQYTFLVAEKHTHTIDAMALSGRKWGGLFAGYLGHDAKQPLRETIDVDFKYQLAQLWRKKLHLSDGEMPDQESFVKNKSLFDVAEQLYRSYDPERSRQESLDQYMEEANGVLHTARGAVAERFGELGTKRGLTPHDLTFARRLEGNLTGRALLSYALTELMPSEDGEANARMLDFLLKNAGADFVESIPALGDNLLSYGPYQYTDAALMSIDEGSGGAKLTRQLGFPVPQSVREVSGSLHHTTAYALAVEACLTAGKRVGSKVSEPILKEFANNPDEVIAFVSLAHHMPKEAYKLLEAYLIHRSKPHSILRKIVAAKPQTFLQSIANPSFATYARKSVINYHALAQPKQIAKAERKV